MYLMRKSSPEPKCITMCLKKLSGHIRQGFSFSRQHSLFRERLHNMNTLQASHDGWSVFKSRHTSSYTQGVGLVGGDVWYSEWPKAV